MAFKNTGYWKSMVNGLKQSNFTTSTSPKLKAYAQTYDQGTAASSGGLKSKAPKGDFVPVFISVGMISLAASFGIFTIWHQLGHAPNVTLKKSRRETIPEVVEPERVAEDAEKFVKGSFFRKVAHVQDFDRQEVMKDPIRGDVLARPVRVESLKDVGVDPVPAQSSPA